jgi:hypothetical protein
MSLPLLAARASIIVLLGCVVACGPSEPSVSQIEIGPDGLRTYTVVHERDGAALTCGAAAVEPHVTGSLAGDPGDDERVWLADATGRRLSVIWPDGFRVTFEPLAVMHNETGRVVARAGDIVELLSVSPDSAEGSYRDPYIASCHLFGRVYVYLPE